MAIKFSKVQQEAIDSFGQNIIVSAGAGSGKTAVLTERIRQILLKGIKASELLVLTFTNAAAKEMKERIVKAMSKDPILKDRVYEIDNAYVTTFDSFSLAMVKKYHERLNLTTNINIIDQSLLKVKKRQIIDELFSLYYQQNDTRFASLISDLTLKDDQNLKGEILKIAEKLALRNDLEQYLKSYVKDYFNNDKITSYIQELNKILLEKITIIKRNFDDFKSAVTELGNSKHVDKMSELLEPLFKASSYNQIKIVLTSRLPKMMNLPEEAKIAKNNISSYLKEMEELTIYNNEDDIKKFYFNSQKYVEIITEILKVYFSSLNEYKEENEVYEFQDIAKMAIKLVTEHQDIQEQTKKQFKEILLDEYQDTNDLQEAFIQAISNNNVYMVGDVKQSIYGFRDANPLIFKAKYDAYKDPHLGKKIDMNVNYRSNKIVLHTINNIFSKIMDNDIGHADFAKEHYMNYGLKDYDKIGIENNIQYINYPQKFKNFKNQDIEMFYILKDIQEKMAQKIQVYDKDTGQFRDIKYLDFAILIADSGLFNNISNLLSYNHIPNKIMKDIAVNEGTITILLKNLLKIITLDAKNSYDNDFKRLFYGLGRSFIFKMTDETLFDMITNNTFKNSDLYSFIASKSSKIKTTSLVDLFSEIIDELDLTNKIIEIGDVEVNTTRIEYFYNLIIQAETLDLNVFEFVSYIDDILDNEDKMEFQQSNIVEDKVNIMTIHKSKGLEFPVVYFINNYKNFNTADFKGKIIYDEKYGIITPFYEDGEGKNINYLLMKHYNTLTMVSEKIRLLYVALTRAREYMIILNPVDVDQETGEIISKPTYRDRNDIVLNPIRENYKNFKDIYQSINDIFDEKILINPDDLNINFDYLSMNSDKFNTTLPNTHEVITHILNPNNATIKESKHASKENKVLNTLENVLNMEYGSKVHEVFESFDFIKQDFTNYNEQEKKMLQNFLNQKIVQDLKKGKIYKEFEFIYQKNEVTIHGIIDLMIEYQDKIDIIDYKLSHVDDEAYVKQLNTYKEYISNKSHKPVNLYLYSINKNLVKEL